MGLEKNHKPKDGVFVGDFPNELWELIFSKMPYGLIDVIRVSPRFNELAMPLLYRNIRLRARLRSAKDYSSFGPNQFPPGLVSETMGQTLNSNPVLCEHVHKLSLKVRDVTWYKNAGGHEKLLKLLPSLTDLSLHPPARKYNFPMNKQLTTMRLNLSSHPECYEIPLWRADTAEFDLDEYLSKPTLRELRVNHHECQFFDKISHSGRPKSSAINRLSLTNWISTNVDIIKSVLPSIRHLKGFVLEIRGQMEGHGILDTFGVFAASDCGLLLGPHAASLEELMIAISYETNNKHTGSSVIGTFTNYRNLRRLAIPEPLLVFAKHDAFHLLLPPQLEELQIQHPIGIDLMDRKLGHGQLSSYHVMSMKKLAKNKPQRIPRLKRVVWWFQQTPRESTQGETPLWNSTISYRFKATPVCFNKSPDPALGPTRYLIELAEDFRHVGVNFEFVLTPSFQDTPFAEYLNS